MSPAHAWNKRNKSDRDNERAEMRGVRTPAACRDRSWTSRRCTINTPSNVTDVLFYGRDFWNWNVIVVSEDGGATDVGRCACGGVPLSAAVRAGAEDSAGCRGARRILHAGRAAATAPAPLLPHRWKPAGARDQLCSKVSLFPYS